jgi:hypothetical protein
MEYILLSAIFFILLIMATFCIYYISILKGKIDKLNNQVYYWSRQIPIMKKQAKSVTTVRRKNGK